MVLGPTVLPDTCLRVMNKKSSFSCFMIIFMSYFPQFLGSRRICMPRKNPYMFERYEKNSSFSRLMDVFMSYCPQFWGSRAIDNDLRTRYMFESYDQKLVVFVFMAIFVSYCL